MIQTSRPSFQLGSPNPMLSWRRWPKWCCLFFALGALSCKASKDLLVSTPVGSIEGFAKNGVGTFLGIPYAKPPTGSLRWSSPVPHEPFDTPWFADTKPPECPQIDAVKSMALGKPVVRGSEDCLYLNVFSSALPEKDRDTTEPLEWSAHKKPVMVFLHGGANEMGDSFGVGGLEIYDGTKLVNAADIVLVTINSRLGLLGHLSLPALDKYSDTGSGSNWALQDLLLALKWVKTNISSFGGNADNITLVGESAGANSVLALLTTKAADGLFEKAILQSTPVAARTLQNARAEAEPVFRRIGCRDLQEEALVSCLRELEIEDIVGGQPGLARLSFDPSLEITKSSRRAMYYAPTVDGKLLNQTPLESLKAGEYSKIPTIIGTIDDELGIVQGLDFGPAKRFREMLLGKEVMEDLVNDAESKILSDFIFHCAANSMTDFLTKSGRQDVYRYTFTDAPWKKYWNQALQSHGIELIYLFQHLDGLKILFPESFKLQQQMTRYWREFMETGNPNHMASPLWMPADESKKNYLDLGEEIEMKNAYRLEQCETLKKRFPANFHQTFGMSF